MTATASGGLATFTGLAVDKAGSGYTIAVSSGTLTGLTSGAFAVTAGPLSELVIASQPSGTVTRGRAVQPDGGGRDAFGNAVPSFDGAIALSLSNDPAVGPLAGISAVRDPERYGEPGLATFPGAVAGRGGVGLHDRGDDGRFERGGEPCAGRGGGPADATGVDGGGAAGDDGGGGVRPGDLGEDGYGNVFTGFTGTIALSLSKNPGDATLRGEALSKPAVGGVVNFGPALTLDVASSGYTLQATSGGLASVTTGGWRWCRRRRRSWWWSAAAVVGVVGPGIRAGGGGVGPVRNANPDFAGTVVVSAPLGTGASVGGQTTVALVGGLGTFAGLTLAGASEPVSLQVNGTGLAVEHDAAGGPGGGIAVGVRRRRSERG